MTRPRGASAFLGVFAVEYGAALLEYVFDASHAPLGLTSPSNIKATRYTPTRP